MGLLARFLSWGTGEVMFGFEEEGDGCSFGRAELEGHSRQIPGWLDTRCDAQEKDFR